MIDICFRGFQNHAKYGGSATINNKANRTLNHASLLDDLAHCLQVQRQNANMNTGLSRQSPASAQALQDELRSLQPLCVTGKKEKPTNITRGKEHKLLYTAVNTFKAGFH